MNQYDTAYSVPFMYIEQPDFQAVEVTMQSNYHSEVKDSNQKQEQKQTTKDQSIVEEENQKFKDLTIQDKIDYLIHVPGEMPPLRCEVQTKEEALQGVIIKEQETEVILRVFGKGYETIEKEKIINIYLIGF